MTPIQAFQDFLWSQEEKITRSLPVHLTAKRFISSTCSYLESHPKIVECDKGSIMDSVIKAAQMGLIIDGVESALVPRKAKCTLMVMFQGLLKKVRNSGELKDIQSAVVYDKDEFDYYTDESGEHLKHRRAWGERGARKLVFAIARTKDGGTYVEVMDASQVDAVKKQGYASSDSPWNGPFQDEMWRKSVIRRMAKRLPSSTDMESFAQDLDSEEKPDPVADDAPKTSSKLAEAVAAAAAPTPEPVKAMEPVKAPEPVKPADPVKPVRANVRGIVDQVVEREYKMEDGSIVKRFAAKIKDVAYGTSSEDWAAIIKTAYQMKTELVITFDRVKNAAGKDINEIIDIGGGVVMDEKPI